MTTNPLEFYTERTFFGNVFYFLSNTTFTDAHAFDALYKIIVVELPP